MVTERPLPTASHTNILLNVHKGMKERESNYQRNISDYNSSNK